CLFPDADGVVAPIAYQQVRALRPLPDTVQVRVLPRSDADPHVPAADVLIADADGQLCMAIDGLHMKVLHGWTASQPPDADIAPVGGHGSPPLLTLARELGIRADEGPWLLQRLLDSSHHQLLASSVTLGDLQALSRTAANEGLPSEATAVPPEPGSPVDGLTARVTRMWQELLGQSPIGPDDDFFELGGHSLIAIRLMSRIQKELGVRLPLATLLAASTVRKLTETLVATHPALGQPAAPAPAPSTAPASPEVSHPTGTPTAVAVSTAPPPATAAAPMCLVPIRPDGHSTPFYIVHGAGGNVLFLWSAVRSLPPHQPVYGFQAVGLDGSDRPDASIQAMADRYVAELLAARPQGPFLLGGYSGGGLIALEMANRLQTAGHDVPCVVLFDSIAPQHIIPPPRERLLNVLGNAMQSGLPALRPYLGKLARRWGRKHLGSLWPESAEEVAARAAEAALLGYHDVSDSGLVDLTPHFDRIVRQWQPGRYAVDTVLLRVEQDWPKYQPDYYWSRYISRPIDIVTVPGDHHAMFAPRNSQALAERLAEVLARHVAD
ncbi:MAG: alpha/beta fold hydrolase, partial [Burkholderiaceae bacterium]